MFEEVVFHMFEKILNHRVNSDLHMRLVLFQNKPKYNYLHKMQIYNNMFVMP